MCPINNDNGLVHQCGASIAGGCILRRCQRVSRRVLIGKRGSTCDSLKRTQSKLPGNGIGNFYLLAVSFRDIPVIQAMVLLFAAIFVGINFLVDLAYAWFDPRIRLA